VIGGTQTIAYDANDHATQIDDGSTITKEVLGPSGRVLTRKVTNKATGLTTEDSMFGYDDSGDSPSYTGPAGAAPTTTYLEGPGGLLLIDTAGVSTYPIQNGHGDIVGTTDALGTFTANPDTDEFGKGDTPANRLGWLGGKERFSTGGTLKLIRMGVRLYDPTLGRFLEVDPVEGGSANDYDYVSQDPANSLDLTGTARRKNPSARAYLTGKAAAPRGFRKAAGYSPRGINTPAGRRMIKASGDCSSIGNKGFEVFVNACKMHDYGYDLIRYGKNIGGKIGFRKSVDMEFLKAMLVACAGRGRDCYGTAGYIYAGVRTGGRGVYFSKLKS